MQPVTEKPNLRLHPQKSCRPAVSGKREAAGPTKSGSSETTQLAYPQPAAGKGALADFCSFGVYLITIYRFIQSLDFQLNFEVK
jgi:hypothetical protein